MHVERQEHEKSGYFPTNPRRAQIVLILLLYNQLYKTAFFWLIIIIFQIQNEHTGHKIALILCWLKQLDISNVFDILV